jgi:accessory gene regulator protein AgrB
MKKNFINFVFAPFVFKDDYYFVMELSEIDLRVFTYASNRIRSSPELMRKSVEKDKISSFR